MSELEKLRALVEYAVERMIDDGLDPTEIITALDRLDGDPDLEDSDEDSGIEPSYSGYLIVQAECLVCGRVHSCERIL